MIHWFPGWGTVIKIFIKDLREFYHATRFRTTGLKSLILRASRMEHFLKPFDTVSFVTSQYDTRSHVTPPTYTWRNLWGSVVSPDFKLSELRVGQIVLQSCSTHHSRVFFSKLNPVSVLPTSPHESFSGLPLPLSRGQAF